MRFHRPARRIALGLGAAGIALGSGGLAIAATALIQPAGALSVQVPAVAVREQNVNSAGRIRVALPKTSVGVNGTVDVGNFPKSIHQSSYQAAAGLQLNSGQSRTVLNVSGPGVLKGAILSDFTGAAYCYSIITDGNVVASGDTGTAAYLGGFSNNGMYRSVWDPQASGRFPTLVKGWATEFTPPGGLPFQHSLQVVLSGCPYISQAQSGSYSIWYTTAT